MALDIWFSKLSENVQINNHYYVPGTARLYIYIHMFGCFIYFLKIRKQVQKG